MMIYSSGNGGAMVFNSLRRFCRARIIPTFGSPGTLDADEALEVFWGDLRVFRDVGKPCDLRAPRLQIWGPKGLILEIDGVDVMKCDECGWPMRRDHDLDKPIENSDGMWQGYRCIANPTHTYLEPFD
jgi:hypothetical protein